jgi:hypothetical protein
MPRRRLSSRRVSRGNRPNLLKGPGGPGRGISSGLLVLDLRTWALLKKGDAMRPFRKKRKQENQKYLHALIQKALPLAQLWFSRMQTCDDPKRAERIVNHLHRIHRVQLRAKIKLARM